MAGTSRIKYEYICMPKGKTYSYNNVKDLFCEANCTLISSHYENNRQILDYICSCGQQSTIRLQNFLKGSRCFECGLKRASAKKRYTIEEVECMFLERGCTLLSKEYKNVLTPLRYKCSCGNTSAIRLFALLKGQTCMKCGHYSGSNSPNWEPDRELLKIKNSIRSRSSHLLKYTLKQMGETKFAPSRLLLGYTKKQLINHLMNHENWSTVSQGDWHIDHIFPITAFIQRGITDLRLINCLDNLRPLAARENIQKSDNYDESKFLIWVEKMRKRGFESSMYDEIAFIACVNKCLDSGFTHRELAFELKVGNSTISNWRNGKHLPRKIIRETFINHMNSLSKNNDKI